MRIPNHNHLTKRRDGFARAERKIGIPCSYSCCCWSDARPHVSPAHLPPIPRTSFDSHPTDPNAQRHSPSIRPTRRHPSHLHSTSALLLISRYSCLAALPFLHDPFPVVPPVNTPSHRPEILPQSPPLPPGLEPNESISMSPVSAYAEVLMQIYAPASVRDVRWIPVQWSRSGSHWRYSCELGLRPGGDL